MPFGYRGWSVVSRCNPMRCPPTQRTGRLPADCLSKSATQSRAIPSLPRDLVGCKPPNHDRMNNRDRKSTTASEASDSPSQQARGERRRRTDVSFFIVMGGISSCFILLIVLLLLADLRFASLAEFKAALFKPEIQFAFQLTILSCTVAALLSIWVATPLGYLLSRYRFPGRTLIDTIVDIPIVLPPLVLGLSLLILFHQPFFGWEIEAWMRDTVGFPITYRWPAVVLAQFSVACAFAVRTMRVTLIRLTLELRRLLERWVAPAAKLSFRLLFLRPGSAE